MKTLKDLDCNSDCNYAHVSREQLKQSAIKWIKTLKNEGYKQYHEIDYHNPLYDFYLDDDAGYSCENVIEWIKYFFDISDEDLK